MIKSKKDEVRELENLNYRKMKKIIMIEEFENESKVGDEDEKNDEKNGGERSKRKRIKYEKYLN